MKIRITALFLFLVMLFTGCTNQTKEPDNLGNPDRSDSPTQGDATDLGDDNKTFGDSLEDLGAYAGYFEGESQDIVVSCVSGTQKAYKLEIGRAHV